MQDELNELRAENQELTNRLEIVLDRVIDILSDRNNPEQVQKWCVEILTTIRNG
jgi:hypothetical protein